MARDYGFSSVCVGQHFLTEYQKLQPIPVLSRLAAESGDMRLLPGIILLPLFNPVYVAEEIATLDVISGGRVILGLGVGYRDVEFEAFGVQKKERGARFEESLEAIKRLWTEDEVSFDGRFFRIPKAQVRTRPLQRPHPPIWVAAQADAGSSTRRPGSAPCASRPSSSAAPAASSAAPCPRRWPATRRSSSRPTWTPRSARASRSSRAS
jgi:alkanesulfonate monooxygenase SsuD/methylene tetrahydromethanopterin reductase-like flavin-dependent oxidoreductase (luciferase family)